MIVISDFESHPVDSHANRQRQNSHFVRDFMVRQFLMERSLIPKVQRIRCTDLRNLNDNFRIIKEYIFPRKTPLRGIVPFYRQEWRLRYDKGNHLSSRYHSVAGFTLSTDRPRGPRPLLRQIFRLFLLFRQNLTTLERSENHISFHNIIYTQTFNYVFIALFVRKVGNRPCMPTPRVIFGKFDNVIIVTCI